MNAVPFCFSSACVYMLNVALVTCLVIIIRGWVGGWIEPLSNFYLDFFELFTLKNS